MAKAGFWLRGAKGKLAGAVAQKGEKGTVLRENVTPANPRTTAQMTHRVIFGTVTSAAKHMLPIIGQSFEGVPNFKENRREFIRKNILELIAANQENNVWPNCSPKGISTIIANNYLISDGSLEFDYATEQDGPYYSVICTHRGLAKGATYTALEFMKKMFDLEPGDQVTAVALATPPEYIYGDEEITRGAVPDIKMYAKRFVLVDDFGSISFTLGADTPDVVTLKANINDLLVQSKCDMSWVDAFFGLSQTYADDLLRPSEISWRTLQTALIPYGVGEIVGFAMFKSKFDNGDWKYSKSHLMCLESAPDVSGDLNIDMGLTPQEAIKSYYQKYSSSDWFTRQGGDINSI